jgi:coenzyme F420-reducing hydrogenase beta subunit
VTGLAPADLVRSGLCIGCGSCVGQAARADARMCFDVDGQLRPAGPVGWHAGCVADFERTCPFSPLAADEDALAEGLFPHAQQADASIGRFLAAYVGFAAEADFRTHGSSGGMVTWVACELLRRGLVDAVAHVHAEDPAHGGRFFRYRLSRSETEVRAGAKSRYYPVEMSGVLQAILREPGRYAVVGIPCFIKAVQLLRSEHPIARDRIRYTLGLFCGHMKSARFVESLAWQMGVPLEDIASIDYRRKLPDRPANWYNATLTLRDGRVLDRDWWRMADGDWGAGFFMDAACNACDDVVAETADVSFGDAWVEPWSSDWRGNNVVVVRSPEIAGFIADAIGAGRLRLEGVDAGFVARTQAAGLRQRREGLAWRLSQRRDGLRLRKRVGADARATGLRRRLVYRMRAAISSWSHRVFRFARRAGKVRVYIAWASVVASAYHALAYPHGRLDKLAERLRLR